MSVSPCIPRDGRTHPTGASLRVGAGGEGRGERAWWNVHLRSLFGSPPVPRRAILRLVVRSAATGDREGHPTGLDLGREICLASQHGQGATSIISRGVTALEPLTFTPI